MAKTTNKLWQRRKANALRSLRKLLDVWLGKRPLEEINAIGHQANTDVLMLGIENVSLPLPFNEAKMGIKGKPSLSEIFRAQQRGELPDYEDEFMKIIDKWTRVIKKAAYASPKNRLESLDDLANPVACSSVAGIVRVRSDNIARKLQRHKYPVVKTGGKYYCNPEHCCVLWPKWRKYWQERQKEE